MSTWTIVVAAGSGARFGGPKQFVALSGRRVIDWSIAMAGDQSDGVVVVVPDGEQDSVVADHVVTGGATRAESVRRGLAVVPERAEFILVHDGARPLASADLYQRVLTELRRGRVAVVPAIAVTDTIRDRSGVALDRDQLVAVQTPQGFRGDVLRRAHASGGEATDDASLVEGIGEHVSIVEGEIANIKITDPRDIAVAEGFMDR